MSHWLGSAGRNFAEQLSLVAIEHRGMSLRQTICWRVPRARLRIKAQRHSANRKSLHST
jgi:hypothetical protein